MPVSLNLSEVWQQRRKQPGRPRCGDFRPDEERDRSRIIHSAAFRRLQAKTQVLGVGESDFHRTRLTHTMEVAQIGRGIVLQLSSDRSRWRNYKEILPTTAQIEAICFAHDLGHPPFGHSGEVGLNFAMRKHGGFEGNGQSLRIVSKLEPHTRGKGLNLTRRILLGILKYPNPYSKVNRTTAPEVRAFPTRGWEPPKCYLDSEDKVVQWILEPLSKNDRDIFLILDRLPTSKDHGKSRHKSLDSSILELADDIAYGTHDLEDGISLKLISQDCFRKAIDPGLLHWATDLDVRYKELVRWLFGPRSREGKRKWAINSLVNALIASIEIREFPEFDCPILRYRARLAEPALGFLNAIKNLIVDRIINSQEVQTLEFRGRKILAELFNALKSDPNSLLNEPFRKRLERLGRKQNKRRVLCDYIAGMTDVFATRFHARLFGTKQAWVFERL